MNVDLLDIGNEFVNENARIKVNDNVRENDNRVVRGANVQVVQADDPNAERLVYIFKHGQTRRVLSVVEGPQVSLAPPSAVPPAIFVSAPAPRKGPVSTHVE